MKTWNIYTILDTILSKLSKIAQRLDSIDLRLSVIEKEQRTMSAELDTRIAALTTSVAALTTTTDSAVALISGFSKMLADAVAAALAAGATPTELQALTDLGVTINAKTKALADAVAANTPPTP